MISEKQHDRTFLAKIQVSLRQFLVNKNGGTMRKNVSNYKILDQLKQF